MRAAYMAQASGGFNGGRLAVQWPNAFSMIRIAPARFDERHVEPRGGQLALGHLLQIFRCRDIDPLPLSLAEAFGGMVDITRFLDLDKYQSVAIFHDQVSLPGSAAPAMISPGVATSRVFGGN